MKLKSGHTACIAFAFSRGIGFTGESRENLRTYKMSRIYDFEARIFCYKLFAYKNVLLLINSMPIAKSSRSLSFPIIITQKNNINLLNNKCILSSRSLNFLINYKYPKKKSTK